MSISKRAEGLIQSPSAIMQGHTLCSENPYSLNNPKGYLNFGTAENHISAPLIKKQLEGPIELSENFIHYSSLHGIEVLRESSKVFFEKHLGLTKINPENIIIQNGVSALCEALSFSLFDEGDAIMLATPYYTGFEYDFTKRFKCKLESVYLDPKNNFKHDIKLFKQTYNKSQNKIKAVLICHPHNPTGEVLDLKFMQDLIDFCIERDLDLISDEIYALSVYGRDKFISLYEMAKNQNCKAHFLYGMAKDFCAGGLKFGFYYSEDQDQVTALKSLSYFHTTSTIAQLSVAKLLADEDFHKNYHTENQKSLFAVSELIKQQLPMYKFISGGAGLFMLLDLSEFCETKQNEMELHKKFINYIRINMTPGTSCGMKQPGYFRVCFARKKPEVLEFIVRMKAFFKNELSQ